MEVLFYTARPGEAGEELIRAMAKIVPEGRLAAISDLQSFSERLRQPRDSTSIALIWNPSRDDLRKILPLKALLRAGRTLLVLADQDDETVALAHGLLPAFIAYVDEGNDEILSVLRKLARTQGPGPASQAS